MRPGGLATGRSQVSGVFAGSTQDRFAQTDGGVWIGKSWSAAAVTELISHGFVGLVPRFSSKVFSRGSVTYADDNAADLGLYDWAGMTSGLAAQPTTVVFDFGGGTFTGRLTAVAR
jgi:hypothetical protein